MAFQKEFSHSNEYDNIIGIQFGIQSAEEIRKRSVCEIKHAIPYENGEPKAGGLFDPRMGVLDHSHRCTTDDYNNVLCPGYFGHIELARPVFYVHFMPYLKKTLSCVCLHCGSLLVDPDSDYVRRAMHLKGKKRADEMANIIKTQLKVQQCGQHNSNGCGAKQPTKIKKESPPRFVVDY